MTKAPEAYTCHMQEFNQQICGKSNLQHLCSVLPWLGGNQSHFAANINIHGKLVQVLNLKSLVKILDSYCPFLKLVPDLQNLIAPFPVDLPLICS